MGCRSRRFLLVGLVLALVVAACGDDGTTPTAPATTGAVTTTTAAWGQAMAPGAEAMLEGSRVLLREDLQDGDTAGWQVDSGWFILESGERRLLGAGGEAWAWYREGLDWSRYGARLAFNVNQGSLGVSVAVSAEGRYLVHVSDAGVYLLKEAPYGSIQALGSSQPVALGEPHVLAAGLDGGHLQVYVDGQLLIDAIDRAPLAGGSIGLGAAAGSSVAVDNIVVVSLGGPLPQIEAVGEPADQPLPDDLADGGPGAGEGLEEGPVVEPGMPNLVVTGVSYPMQIEARQPFDVVVSVRNVGAGAAGRFGVFFSSNENGGTEFLAGLGASETATVTLRFPGYGAERTYDWAATVDHTGLVDEGAREDDNAAQGTITIGSGEPEESLPNLAVAWRTWEPDPPSPDEPAVLEIGIAQTQTGFRGDLPAYIVRVNNVRAEDSVCNVVVSPGVDVATCELPPFGEPGDFEMEILLDLMGEVAETTRDDNTEAFTIAVRRPGQGNLPDLAVTGVTLSPAQPGPNEPFTITATFADLNGAGPLPMYTVQVWVNHAVLCSEDGNWASGSIVCRVPGQPAGPHDWGVVVDSEREVDETDPSELNNAEWHQLQV